MRRAFAQRLPIRRQMLPPHPGVRRFLAPADITDTYHMRHVRREGFEPKLPLRDCVERHLMRRHDIHAEASDEQRHHVEERHLDEQGQANWHPEAQQSAYLRPSGQENTANTCEARIREHNTTTIMANSEQVTTTKVAQPQPTPPRAGPPRPGEP